MSSDEWIRERALKDRASDDEQRKHVDEAKRHHDARLQIVREQLPPLWRELAAHLKRKVDLYNNGRGTTALSLIARGDDEKPRFIELARSDGDRTSLYSITSDLSTGHVASKTVTGGPGGRGEGSGNIMMTVESGMVRFGVTGAGYLGTEDLADWLLRHVLDR